MSCSTLLFLILTHSMAKLFYGKYICNEYKPGDKVDVVYTVELDNWSGNNNLVMILEDIKASS